MKRILSVLLLLAMLATMLTVPTVTATATDSEQMENTPITPDTSWYTGPGPYYINDAADLLGLVELTHAKANGDYSVTKGKTFYLTADIDLNPGWTVGDATVPVNLWKGIAALAGTLDGQGHTVRGLYAPNGLSSGPNPNELGFIDRVVTGGAVKNINLTNGYLASAETDSLGSLVGCVHWGGMPNGTITIENCYSDLTMVANSTGQIGGIYGTAWQDGNGSVTVQVSNTVFCGTIQVNNMKAAVGQFAGRAGWVSGHKKMDAVWTNCYFPAGNMYGTAAGASITVNSTPVYQQKSAIDPKTNTYSIRILSGIGSTNWKNAGFRILLTNSDGTTESKFYTTTKAYRSIRSAGKAVAASELNSAFQYLYYITLDDIPADKGFSFTVLPFLTTQTNNRIESAVEYRDMQYQTESVLDSWESLIPSYAATASESYKVDEVSTVREYANVTKADLDRFIASLKARGFSVSHENTLGDNSHAFASNGAVNIHLSLLAADRALRVYSEPALRANPNDTAQIDGVREPKLWQLRVDNINSRANGGMSYVWLLADNTFFIIDGGYNTGLEADNLYAFLTNICEQEGIEGKPVISAWYFSHTDGDHIGAFQAFAPRYADKVDVKAFYYHFQNDIPSGFLTAAQYWNDAVHYSRLHTGMKIELPGISVNVIYTLEDLYKTNFKFSSTFSGNNYCTVIRVDVRAGDAVQKVMFLGDIQLIASNCITKNYRTNHSALKSDIVQFSHHGYEGGTKELYDAIAAPTVLWPINIVSTQENYGSVCNVFLRWKMGTRDTTWSEVDPVTGETLTTQFTNNYMRASAPYCVQIILAGAVPHTEINFPYTPKKYANGTRLPNISALYSELKPILVPDESNFTFS